MSESNALSAARSAAKGEVEGQLATDARRAQIGAADLGFFVYILRCADGTYYVGSTTDVPARVEAHSAGRGPRFTARRRPVTLVHSEPMPTMDQARRREMQIKKWSRAKKEALIAGETHRLHELSIRRIP